MEKGRMKVPTIAHGPVEVDCYTFEWAQGLAITQTIVPVLKLKPLFHWEMGRCGYSITHVPSGREVVGHMPSLVVAHKTLRLFCEQRIDWTKDYDSVRRSMTMAQREMFKSVQAGFKT